MSYARFTSDSDVYIFVSTSQCLECCGCIRNERSQQFETTAEMLVHLEEHRALGDQVPDYCIEALKADAEENDEWIRTGKWREK